MAKEWRITLWIVSGLILLGAVLCGFLSQPEMKYLASLPGVTVALRY